MANSWDVAVFMLEQLESQQVLYQEVVVYQIIEKFGEEFTYINVHGNPAIDKKVLREFRRLTRDTVVWMRGERAWRKRHEHDPPGRQTY
jgi:hypothetical protein